jgi:hypothetical protein
MTGSECAWLRVESIHMSVTTNPYAPPKARVEDVVQSSSDAEAIRREFLKHETSVRSIGTLYYLAGGLLCVGALFLAYVYFSVRSQVPVTIIAPIYVLLGVLSILLGRGIKSLHPWARTTAVVLACVGLLGVPVGTAINGYILYLLLSKKGKRIFEADYADIVAATPHIKYRESLLTWILLTVAIVLFVAIVTVSFFR